MKAIPVCMVVDDGYLPFAATTLVSICENTQERIACYILAHNIPSERKQKFEEGVQTLKGLCGVRWIDVRDEWLEGLVVGKHISVVTYARIFIPEVVKAEKKVLFTDVDVLFQGDVGELYREKFDDCVICAVPEDDVADGHREDKKRLEIPEDAIYFNAGLLLIDCEKWRAGNWTKRLLDDVKQDVSKFTCYDQDLLNRNMYSSYKSLSKKWCWIRQRAKFERANVEYLKDPGIRHFNGRVKPWLCLPSFGGLGEKGVRLGTKSFWLVAQKTVFFDEICSIRAKEGWVVRLLGKSLVQKLIVFLLKF